MDAPEHLDEEEKKLYAQGDGLVRSLLRRLSIDRAVLLKIRVEVRRAHDDDLIAESVRDRIVALIDSAGLTQDTGGGRP